MERSSGILKRKHDNIDDNSTGSLQSALNLIESNDSNTLRELLIRGESDINLDNGTGRKLLMAASDLQQLDCLRALLDYLESLKAVDQASDSSYYQSAATYISKGRHRFIKIDSPTEDASSIDKPLMLFACKFRYYSDLNQYYSKFEIAEFTRDESMNEYIFVNASYLLVELCSKKDIKLFKYLISMGADVNDVDYHGRNAAVLTCYRRKVDVLELLLENGADANTRCYALKHDSCHFCCCCIRYFDNVYDSYPSWDGFHYDSGEPRCKEGDTLLLMACTFNDVDMMKLLLERGADVNALDKDGCTPFMRLYTGGHDDVREAIGLLFQCDIDLNIMCPDEVKYSVRYPLLAACREADIKLIGRMLIHGADAKVVDKDGRSALIWLLDGIQSYEKDKKQVLQCFKMLLEYGADVMAEDCHGKTVFD